MQERLCLDCGRSISHRANQAKRCLRCVKKYAKVTGVLKQREYRKRHPNIYKKYREKDEFRNEKGQFYKGCISLSNTRVGFKQTEEARERISKRLKGRKKPPRSAQHRKNLSKSIQDGFCNGRVVWNKNKTLDELFDTERAKEIREKNRQARIGKPSHRKGMTYEEEYGIERAKELKRKNSEGQLGKTSWNKNIPCREETKRRIAAWWNNPEYRKKCLVHNGKSGLEKRMEHVIQKHNLPFIYTGLGDTVIGNKTPDFVHSDGEKIVIEVFSTYHKNNFRDGGYSNWRKTRTILARKYGWKILYFDDDKNQITGKYVLKVMKRERLI